MLVLFNGPPGVGKTTLGDAIAGEFQVAVGDVIRQGVAKETSLPVHYFADRGLKDNPEMGIDGKSPRQLLIDYATFIKQVNGEDYYIKEVAARLRAMPSSDVLIPDLGFEHELEYLASRWNKILVVKLTREGLTFEGDNRKYVTTSYPNVYSVEVDTGCDVNESLRQIEDALRQAYKSP